MTLDSIRQPRGDREFPQSDSRSPAPSQFVQHLGIIGWILMMLVCLVWASGAEAARNPAPNHLVRAALQAKPPARGTVAKRAWAICHVFKRSRCRAALNVAWCESGLRPWAKNGQYRGIFQMGSYERGRFGHSSRNVWVQARAARKYFLRSHWHPWECKP